MARQGSTKTRIAGRTIDIDTKAGVGGITISIVDLVTKRRLGTGTTKTGTKDRGVFCIPIETSKETAVRVLAVDPSGQYDGNSKNMDADPGKENKAGDILLARSLGRRSSAALRTATSRVDKATESGRRADLVTAYSSVLKAFQEIASERTALLTTVTSGRATIEVTESMMRLNGYSKKATALSQHVASRLRLMRPEVSELAAKELLNKSEALQDALHRQATNIETLAEREARWKTILRPGAHIEASTAKRLNRFVAQSFVQNGRLSVQGLDILFEKGLDWLEPRKDPQHFPALYVLACDKVLSNRAKDLEDYDAFLRRFVIPSIRNLEKDG